MCVKLTNAGEFEQQRSRPPPAAEAGRRGWGSAPLFQSPAKGLRKKRQAQLVRPAVQSGGQKSPSRAFLDARLAISTRAHQKTSTYENTLRFLFLSAQGRSSMQYTLKIEKNGAFVTNLSQKDYKRPFSPRKDCETIVYLVSYRGDWPSVPVCEKK